MIRLPTVINILFLFMINRSSCYAQTTYGIFVSPTVGLDNIGNEYYRAFVHGFGNDRLPLMGISVEYGDSFCSWSTRVGYEPILNFGNYYGASFDLFQQLVFGKSWFRPTIGTGYMYRTLDHFTLRQNYIYCAVALSFRIRNKFTIEPSYCFGFLYEDTSHPSIGSDNYGGRYTQDWLRINLIYHF